jgi:phage terminase small subunit
LSKAKNPKADQALEMYKRGLLLKDIAKELNVPEGTVRRWKSTYKWGSEQSERSDNKANVRIKRKNVADDVTQVMGNPDLTDKQRLFCLYYVKLFNATKAYQKAYGVGYETAATNGSRMLDNAKVREEISRLKQNRLNRELLDEHDIFQKYLDIAFADITDFVEFRQEEQQVMGAFGPVQVDGKPLMKLVNVVRFHDSAVVDGSLISEVKQGKDGASIKLADRMKALDWLSSHMNLATEEQKLRMEQIKATIAASSSGNEENGPIVFNILPASTRPKDGDPDE